MTQEASNPPVLPAVMLADVILDPRHFGRGGAGRLGAARQRVALCGGSAHRDALAQRLDVGARQHVLLAQHAQQALKNHQAFFACMRVRGDHGLVLSVVFPRQGTPITTGRKGP
ncbi:hypothetical protein SPHINGO8AM_200119 [Sphingomonas sp. 8AM]|nr:hypothetical protein SPHINGO8AM_200119 [Sphingomonas sp. 8AM]